MNCRIQGFDAGGERVWVSLEIKDVSEALAEAERMGIGSPDISLSGCEHPPFHPAGGACRLQCSIRGVDETGKPRSALVQVDSEVEAIAAAERMGVEQPSFRWYGHWPAATATPFPQTSPTHDVGASPDAWGNFWKGLWVGFIGGFLATFRPFKRD